MGRFLFAMASLWHNVAHVKQRRAFFEIPCPDGPALFLRGQIDFD